MQLGSIHLANVGNQGALPSNRNAPPTNPGEEREFIQALQDKLTTSSSPTRRLVAARRTHLSTEQASSALSSAWSEQFGEEPSEKTVAVLTAQWSHETGDGRSMFNFNFGGIKGKGPSGLSVNQRTKEGWGATEKTIRDNFRAYQSAQEGAGDYISLLKRRYPAAIEAAAQGEPGNFVRELKNGGYFTGNEASYVRSITQKTATYLGEGPPAFGSTTPPIASEPASLGAPRSAAAPPSLMANSGPRAPSPEHFSLSQRGGNMPLSSLDLGAGAFLSSGNSSRTALPNVNDLRLFDDALSRAALRIALNPDRDGEDS